MLEGVALKIWAAEPAAYAGDAVPGTIVGTDAAGVTIVTGNGALRATQLQKPGGKRLAAREFLAGTSLKVGQRFDSEAPG
jgi:methionyl-tRNA formyltransferase